MWHCNHKQTEWSCCKHSLSVNLHTSINLQTHYTNSSRHSHFTIYYSAAKSQNTVKPNPLCRLNVTSATSRDVPFSPNSITPTSPKLPWTGSFGEVGVMEFGLKGMSRLVADVTGTRHSGLGFTVFWLFMAVLHCTSHVLTGLFRQYLALFLCYLTYLTRIWLKFCFIWQVLWQPFSGCMLQKSTSILSESRITNFY